MPIFVLMYTFETLLIIEIVDADDTVCCVPTGQIPFVLLFGQIPHSNLDEEGCFEDMSYSSVSS